MGDGRYDEFFSGHAAAYAEFRPRYPAALGLAEHFEQVLATDPSAAQLTAATRRPRVTYRHLTREPADLADGSFELVVAAQAAHWFDLERFYLSVRRLLVPGGLAGPTVSGRGAGGVRLRRTR